MAHETVTISAGTWELLTSSDVTTARIQNLGTAALVVQATDGTTAPADASGAIEYQPSQGDFLDLAETFPGVSGAVRLWGKMERAGRVSVSF